MKQVLISRATSPRSTVENRTRQEALSLLWRLSFRAFVMGQAFAQINISVRALLNVSDKPQRFIGIVLEVVRRVGRNWLRPLLERGDSAPNFIVGRPILPQLRRACGRRDSPSILVSLLPLCGPKDLRRPFNFLRFRTYEIVDGANRNPEVASFREQADDLPISPPATPQFVDQLAIRFQARARRFFR